MVNMLKGEFPGSIQKQKQKHLVLLGPTSIGKGFIYKQLTKYAPVALGMNIDCINMGERFRNLMDPKHKNFDREFMEKWKPIVANGNLIDDHTACAVYSELLGASKTDLVVNDGFHRTVRQIEHAEQLDVMRENSIVLWLLGTYKTCRIRALHRQKTKTNGERFDEDSFDKRYWEFNERTQSLMEAIQRTGTRIYPVNANRELREVFEDVLPYLGLLISEIGLSCNSALPFGRLPTLSTFPEAVLV